MATVHKNFRFFVDIAWIPHRKRSVSQRGVSIVVITYGFQLILIEVCLVYCLATRSTTVEYTGWRVGPIIVCVSHPLLLLALESGEDYWETEDEQDVLRRRRTTCHLRHTTYIVK
jgi:hypothetical protein